MDKKDQSTGMLKDIENVISRDFLGRFYSVAEEERLAKQLAEKVFEELVAKGWALRSYK